MTILWIDLETRSRCDLPRYGLYNYAQDPSTEIMIACWAVDMSPTIARWERLKNRTYPLTLFNMLRDPGVEVRAHSAAFERLLIQHAWKITLAPERFYCTAFQARACAIPASLEDMGRALTASMQKNPRGHQLINLLSKPRADGSFNEDPDLYREFADYCAQDVGAMRVASCMLPALEPEALRLWRANETINDRGLPIDTELCEMALGYAEEAKDEAEANVRHLTGGVLSKARGKKITERIYDEMPSGARELMDVMRKRAIADVGGGRADVEGDPGGNTGNSSAKIRTGESYPSLSLDAATREAIFAMAEERPGDFGETGLALLEALDNVMAASVHKFARMRDTASRDGRLRGAFVANGASGTGRFSSRGAQLHNLPRVTALHPEAIRKLMKKRLKLPGPVLAVLKSMLRPAICPGAGRRIVRCDYNAIEARVLPWLTGQPAAQEYLGAFLDPLRDVYLEVARACGLGENRAAGKVIVLALGFGGGERALAIMCKAYGVVIENKAQVVQRWRATNRWAPWFWAELERRARWALPNGNAYEAGMVRFSSVQWDRKRTLKMQLPSGRELYYPYMESDERGLHYLKAAWKPKAGAEDWPHARVWGGLISENATQAAAADLLRHAIVQAVEMGLPVIGHVHDELIGEAATGAAPALAVALQGSMLGAPLWAHGLPLAAETDVAPRYRK